MLTDFCGDFRKKKLKIGGVENLSFFESANSNIFFKKKMFFASSPRKSVNIYNVARMGRNFDDCTGLQQKSKCAHIYICYTVYV